MVIHCYNHRHSFPKGKLLVLEILGLDIWHQISTTVFPLP